MITAQQNRYQTTWDKINQEFHCDHNEQRLVKYQQSTGAWRIRRQCQRCGEYTTSDLPQNTADLTQLPVFDAALRDQYRERKRAAHDATRHRLLSDLERERLTEREKWWANYNRYLQSEHWKNLRLLVLKRDKHLCQNCFRPITEATAHVHHLSYVGFERTGKSYAFECVSLCASCHIEFHPGM